MVSAVSWLAGTQLGFPRRTSTLPRFFPFPVSHYMEGSINGGTPKLPILVGFSIVIHPCLGTPLLGNREKSVSHLLQWPWTTWTEGIHEDVGQVLSFDGRESDQQRIGHHLGQDGPNPCGTQGQGHEKTNRNTCQMRGLRKGWEMNCSSKQFGAFLQFTRP